jgi:hypothetical protein
MEELLYKTTFWISRVYELTPYRYTESSQSLMLFSDRTFELRWVDYAQNSALEPSSLGSVDVHLCVSGSAAVVSANTIELTPNRKFEGSEEVPLDVGPFRCFVNLSVLTVDSPLQKDLRFNRLTLSKSK